MAPCSLDTEEQLIAENERLNQRLDEGTELVAEGLLINEFLNRKVAEQDKEIQRLKHGIIEFSLDNLRPESEFAYLINRIIAPDKYS